MTCSPIIVVCGSGDADQIGGKCKVLETLTRNSQPPSLEYPVLCHYSIPVALVFGYLQPLNHPKPLDPSTWMESGMWVQGPEDIKPKPPSPPADPAISCSSALRRYTLKSCGREAYHVAGFGLNQMIGLRSWPALIPHPPATYSSVRCTVVTFRRCGGAAETSGEVRLAHYETTGGVFCRKGGSRISARSPDAAGRRLCTSDSEAG